MTLNMASPFSSQCPLTFASNTLLNYMIFFSVMLYSDLPCYSTDTTFIQTLFTSLQYIVLQIVFLLNSLYIRLSCRIFHDIFLKQDRCFVDFFCSRTFFLPTKTLPLPTSLPQLCFSHGSRASQLLCPEAMYDSALILLSVCASC